MKKKEIITTIQQALANQNAVLLIRTGGTVKTERFITSITKDSFTHTTATGNNISKLVTLFDDVATVSIIEGDYSTLTHFKKQFSYSKLGKMNKSAEEKELNQKPKAKFLCGKKLWSKGGRKPSKKV